MRTLELAPVIEIDKIRAQKHLLGYDALCLWFSELPSEEGSDSKTKILNLGEQSIKLAHLSRNASYRSGVLTTSLSLSDAESPFDKVTLRGRKTYNRVADLSQHIDLVDDNELAWKIRSPTHFDLVAKNMMFSANSEPPLVSVTSSEVIDSMTAEERLLDTLGIIASAEQ